MAETEKTLRGEPFLINNGDQYYRLPTAGQAHHRITEQLVERPLFSHLVKKAPGADKLSFRAIHRRWRGYKTRIIE
jgi:hypothetical protein